MVGLDLDTGLGVVKLEGDGPWPAATLGDSGAVAAGARTGTVGVDEDNDLVQVTGTVHAVRRFSAYWEYMLDRAIIVAPASPQWGGSAVVNERGEVIGIASLRLGEPPHVNLAIPIEKFVPVKDELIASGRIVSRPPRPWLGLYTVAVAGRPRGQRDSRRWGRRRGPGSGRVIASSGSTAWRSPRRRSSTSSSGRGAPAT